jgi:hypothetical protein
VREYGWFRQHEAELIEAARRRIAERQAASRAGALERAREWARKPEDDDDSTP